MGTHLTRRLLDDGHEVVVVSRSTGSVAMDEDAGTLDRVEASVTDRAALTDVTRYGLVDLRFG